MSIEIELIRNLVASGCDWVDETDRDVYCHYCDAYLTINNQHDEECAYKEAKRYLDCVDNRKTFITKVVFSGEAN